MAATEAALTERTAADAAEREGRAARAAVLRAALAEAEAGGASLSQFEAALATLSGESQGQQSAASEPRETRPCRAERGAAEATHSADSSAEEVT